MNLAELYNFEIFANNFPDRLQKNTQFCKCCSQSAKPLDLTDTQFVLLPQYVSPPAMFFYTNLHFYTKLKQMYNSALVPKLGQPLLWSEI